MWKKTILPKVTPPVLDFDVLGESECDSYRLRMCTYPVQLMVIEQRTSGPARKPTSAVYMNGGGGRTS